jgi:hypothetical protein
MSRTHCVAACDILSAGPTEAFGVCGGEASRGAVKKGMRIPALLQSRTTILGLPIQCRRSVTHRGIY